MSSVSVVSCAGSSIRSAPSVIVAAVVGIAALPAGLVETFAKPLWSNLGYTGQSTGSLLAHVRGRRNRADDIGRHQLLPLSSPHTTSSAGTPVNQQVRRIADLGRVIHEPGRLMIVTLLYAVERTNFVPAARNGYEQRYALQSYFPARGGSLCRRGENLSGEGATDALTSDHSRPQSV